MVHIVNLNEMIFMKNYYNELLEKGIAYKCYCTEEELEQEREEQIARG